jgi:hypothetical protein
MHPDTIKSLRAAAIELRRLADIPRYKKYAAAHRLTADDLDQQCTAAENAS